MPIRRLAGPLLAVALLAPSLGNAPDVAAASPPACTYTDVQARNQGYASWSVTLVDTVYRLTSTYSPRDLVPASRAGISGGGYVRSIVIRDLTAMTRAARRAGAPIAIQSAYRSYSTQVTTFAYWVSVAGRKRALLASARPGHSEHQLGTAVDFKSSGGGSPFSGDWARTRAGAWMKANGWKYGWINSYPAGISPSRTCYQYEPWHYRYVGRASAATIHAAGGNSRLWLWNHQS